MSSFILEVINTTESPIIKKRGRPIKYTNMEEFKKANNEMSLKNYYENVKPIKKEESRIRKLERIEKNKQIEIILLKLKYELKENNNLLQTTLLTNVINCDLSIIISHLKPIPGRKKRDAYPSVFIEDKNI